VTQAQQLCATCPPARLHSEPQYVHAHQACTLSGFVLRITHNCVLYTRLQVAEKLELVAVVDGGLPGGLWDLKVDGGDPQADVSVLIITAIRTVRDDCSIDLSGCRK
jgi:DBC1